MKRLGVRAAVMGAEIVPGDVIVEDGRIVSLGNAPAGRSGLATPGYVDLQVNGFAGVDFAEADAESTGVAAAGMARTGVTAFQPTLITSTEDDYLSALARLAEAQRVVTAPRILGVHLEGPFLSPDRAGAHDPSLIVEPDPDLADRLLAAGPVTHVTVAPERPGGVDLVSDLVRAGVTVAVGHSDADAETALAAFNAGARAVTHLFNAQRRFHHRDGGIAFAALARKDVVVTVINDGVHLAPEVVQVVALAARGRMALVTDAVAAAQLRPGRYRLGNQDIVVTEEAARLEDGILVGSILTMDRAVRKLIGLGVPLADAVAAATSVPANLARRPDLASLAPGTPADVAVLDEDYRVVRTMVGGEEVFRA